MPHSLNQELIDDILKLAKDGNDELYEKIEQLITSYHSIQKQNSYFIKKWDKHSLIAKEKELKKDKMLEQQSRLATMGEMIDTIAHQWKQPLNSISMLSNMLKDDFKKDLVDMRYIDELDDTIQMQIEHMINTLSEFRKFFRPDTNKESFTIEDCVKSVKVLLKDELVAQNVNIYTNIDEAISIYANKNEFKHLFINLINNSIDAYNERGIDKRDIFIECKVLDNQIIITFKDNAGGIDKDILEDIFQPNFTTKAEGKGSGVGLYIASKIIEKYDGFIKANSTDVSAIFTITLNNSII